MDWSTRNIRWHRVENLDGHSTDLEELVQVHIRGQLVVLVDIEQSNRITRPSGVLGPDKRYRLLCNFAIQSRLNGKHLRVPLANIGGGLELLTGREFPSNGAAFVLSTGSKLLATERILFWHLINYTKPFK